MKPSDLSLRQERWATRNLKFFPTMVHLLRAFLAEHTARECRCSMCIETDELLQKLSDRDASIPGLTRARDLVK